MHRIQLTRDQKKKCLRQTQTVSTVPTLYRTILLVSGLIVHYPYNVLPIWYPTELPLKNVAINKQTNKQNRIAKLGADYVIR